MHKKFVVSLLVLLVLSTALGIVSAEELELYFFDVGQAESTLLKGSDYAILIDAGERNKTDVIDQLTELGVDTIDLLILTHPHADHIGQAAQIIGHFNVREVWMSGYEHTTRLFEGVLDAILDSDADYYEPRRGEVFSFGQLMLEILNPLEIANDLHDTCIIIRASFGDMAFLFTGDAERKTEAKLVQSALPLKAQVLQLGHHGSRTSSSLDFLVAVDPEVAIYSAGIDNEFGHPHPEVLDRLKILEIPVYGTDLHSTIVVKTDGKSYSLGLTKGGERGSEWAVSPFGIDINSAPIHELVRIIHIGPARAEEIVRLRKMEPFTSVDDLRRVSGISESRLDDIKAQGLAYVKGGVED